jgi:hypothetical protein
MFKKLKDKTKSEGGSSAAGSPLKRSDSQTSLNSTHSTSSAVSHTSSTPVNRNRMRMASNLQGSAADSDVRVRQLEAKLAGTVKHTFHSNSQIITKRIAF